MYPPRRTGQAGYAPLATDDIAPASSNLEDAYAAGTGEGGERELEANVPSFDINDTFEYEYDDDSGPQPLKRRLGNLGGHRVFRLMLLTLAFLLVVVLVFKLKILRPGQLELQPQPQSPNPNPNPNPGLWTKNALDFTSPRPAYLSSPLSTPLIIRLAIIARVDAFERRQAIREAVLRGIKREVVEVEYRFFVARPREDENEDGTRLGLEREREAFGDVEVVQGFRDVPERISEKRFEALKWTNAVPHDTYDYSMTIDSDTFCRFSALARRLAYTHPHARPREQPIMIGRMGEHLVYFQNTVPDGNVDDLEEDYFVKGPWYKYPIGIGYMLSSNLTKTILDLDPPVAHHINYPSDDVMIGSWIGALRYYHDPTAVFLTTERDPPADRVVRPTPLLPYKVDTEIVDDQVGWHDVWRKEDGEDARGKRAIGWDSVCVHRMGIEQMRALRAMEEVRDEWDMVAVQPGS